MQKKSTVMIFMGLAICALIGVYLLYTNSLASIKRDADFIKLCLNNGSLQQINDAIKNGANVNARDEDGLTPLFCAAISNPTIITALISAGADVNAKDKQGMTSLMLLALSQKANPEAITALIKAGADVNAKTNKGTTALMGAVLQKRNPEVITTLLELGADPKVKNGDGKMAIDYARENEKLENTEVLRRLEEASK